MSGKLDHIYSDDRFAQFLVRVLAPTALKQAYIFFKAIDQPYLDDDQVVEIGKRLMAAGDINKLWDGEGSDNS